MALSVMNVSNIENTFHRSDFFKLTEEKSQKSVISQQLHHLRQDSKLKENPILAKQTSNFCYKFLFTSTSADRKLNDMKGIHLL